MRPLVAPVIAAMAIGSAAYAAPDREARALIDHQVAVFRHADDDTLRALFAPDAIINGYKVDERGADLSALYVVAGWFGGSPHTELRKLAVRSLVADGDATTLWLTAELDATAYIPEPGYGATTESVTLRLSELAVKGADGWRVVAATCDHPGQPAEATANIKPDEYAGATSAGPLSAMLAAPASTAAALPTTAGTFVIGTDAAEHATGAAAKKLLAGWGKLALAIEGTPREVHTATWGFAQATVAWTRGGKTVHMRGLVIATPRADGTWTPVGVHYTPWRW